LVVDKKHFTEDYLSKNRIYFEPFHSHVKEMIKDRKDFALRHIPAKDQVFAKDDLFVIHRESLRPK